MTNNKENSNFTENKNDAACLPREINKKLEEKMQKKIEELSRVTFFRRKEYTDMQKKIEDLELENNNLKTLENVAYSSVKNRNEEQLELLTKIEDLEKEVKCLNHNLKASRKFNDNQFDNALKMVNEKDEQLLNAQSQIEVLVGQVKQLKKSLEEINYYLEATKISIKDIIGLARWEFVVNELATQFNKYSNVEIIGNIHENPELLKEQSND